MFLFRFRVADDDVDMTIVQRHRKDVRQAHTISEVDFVIYNGLCTPFDIRMDNRDRNLQISQRKSSHH